MRKYARPQRKQQTPDGRNGTVEISRVLRSKQEAQATYDRLSRWYDAFSGSAERSCMEAGLQTLAAQPGERVLEVGFGTGHALLTLARSVGPCGRVYGVDLSPGMVRVARNRIERAGLAERLDLTCADAGELPYQAQSFDAVFLCFTLELFDTPEIPSFLAQCFRVLKTEGRIGVVAMAKRERESLAVKLYEWAHKRFPKEIDCRPIMVEQALADAGFHPVEAQRMSIYRLPVDVVLARKRTPSD